MTLKLFAAIAILLSASSALADEQRVDARWPSIIYYGDGENQRVSEQLFWDGQAGLLAEQRKRAETSGYGAISALTGQPRTQHVSGYTRRDGTRVQSYYRSHR